MGNTLVIVESPAKAKTITRYLGPGYTVRASMGHVRDLPARLLGVEVDNGTFEPQYETVKGRIKTVSEIRTLAKGATTVLLATDPDREGEAIAWHIVAAAGLGRAGQRVSRVEFHEITERAIKAALASPRQIDMNLVNAQQARRVLDRLVGYKLSPLLWRKISKGTSAGRVQSVALRVVVERERAIETFVPREFWTVEADLARSPFSGQKADVFHAVLWNAQDKKKQEFENGQQAQAVVDALPGARWTVANLVKKEVPRRASPPFTTSTLQQEAARKLHYKTQDTMRIAQQLYEGVSLGPDGTQGLITYMRTDSTNVAYEAQMSARDVIKELFGPAFLPDKPPFYTKKAKGAQEAHEAIRPTKPAREPDALKNWLTPQQYQLYRLIWRRFIASQMAPALIEQTTVDVKAEVRGQGSEVRGDQGSGVGDRESNLQSTIYNLQSPPPQSPTPQSYLFRASGERVVFPGFLRVYREGQGDSDAEEQDAGSLPMLAIGDLLDLIKLLAEQHFTEPPPRYGEASLVKALEELGVGRPSTYATILSTIRDRGYVVELKDGKERKFHPTELGRAVNDLLVAQFPDLLDVQFTARLEGELDEVADGKRQWTPLVASVYGPMMEKLQRANKEVAKIEVPPETLKAEPVSGSSGRSYGRRGSSSAGSSSSRSYPRRSTTTASGESEGTTRRSTRTAASGAATVAKPVRRSRTTSASSSTAADKSVRRTTPRKTASTAAQVDSSESWSDRFATGESSRARPATVAARPTGEITTQTVSCPMCQKAMVRRKGPYGEFWGCTGYPTCRGTRKD